MDNSPLKPDGNYIGGNHPIFKASVPLQGPNEIPSVQIPPVRPDGLIDDSAPNLANVLLRQNNNNNNPGHPLANNVRINPDLGVPDDITTGGRNRFNDVAPGSIPPGGVYFPINPPGMGGPSFDSNF